jgi:hypothetical protein
MSRDTGKKGGIYAKRRWNRSNGEGTKDRERRPILRRQYSHARVLGRQQNRDGDIEETSGKP